METFNTNVYVVSEKMHVTIDTHVRCTKTILMCESSNSLHAWAGIKTIEKTYPLTPSMTDKIVIIEVLLMTTYSSSLNLTSLCLSALGKFSCWSSGWSKKSVYFISCPATCRFKIHQNNKIFAKNTYLK